MLDQEFTFQNQNSSFFYYCHSFISFIIFTIISHWKILEDLEYDSIVVYVLSFHCYNLGIHFFFFSAKVAADSQTRLQPCMF